MSDYIPQPGEPLTPGALRTVASWLDLYDEMAGRYCDLLEAAGLEDPERLQRVRAATSSTEMQDDLRRWADEMEASA